jgi:Glycosyl hydrolase family 99
MTARQLRLFTVVAALTLLVPASAGARGPANRPHMTAHPGPIRVTTVPIVKGVRVVAGSRTFVTDARGAIRLPSQELIPRLKVLPTTLGPGVEARFTRWYRGRIALGYWYRITPRFSGPNGPVTNRISEFRMHSSIGLRTVRKNLQPFWIQGTRIVPFTQGLRKKAIKYAVDSVTVDGANVVNRSQQKFVPAQSADLNLKVRLLFNVARFTARDAIFHFPVGSGVRLKYPNGRTQVQQFNHRNVITVGGLPRGQYRVQVVGAGWAPMRPVAVSRTQDVKLAVITYLDIAVLLAVFAAAGYAIFLYRGRFHSRPSVAESVEPSEVAHWIPRRRAKITTLLVVALLALALLVPAARASSGPAPVFAYYYIWFNPSSWNRAKVDYPLLGRYASDDRAVMRQHIKWAKAAGIDGFLVSWKDTPVLDQRLQKLMGLANQMHFRLGIVYEGLDFKRRPLPATRVARDLRTFETKYASNRAFSSFGKPLIIWSGTWEFTPSEIASVTRERRARLRILASEKNAPDYERIASLVDGDAYYWSSVNPQTDTNFEQKLGGMAAAVHRHGGMWIPPAAPGFDARLIGGTREVPRRDGETLRTEMAAATAAEPDMIGLISWNEFSENSQVEPSRKYGSRYLEVLAAIDGRKVKLATDIESADPSTGGTGWQVPLLGLVAIGIGGTLIGVRNRERTRPKRRARV